jgi:hypothetical protein
MVTVGIIEGVAEATLVKESAVRHATHWWPTSRHRTLLLLGRALLILADLVLAFTISPLMVFARAVLGGCTWL